LPIVYVTLVRRARAILAFALALLWLGLPVHCQLEVVAASSVISCCPESRTCPAQQDSESHGDFCGSLESGKYFPQKSNAAAKAPILHTLSFTPEPSRIERLLQTHPLLPDAIPVLASSWQFVSRAAAPPRAPSMS
jgi:hypothetical protein